MSNKNEKLFPNTHFHDEIVSAVSLVCKTDFVENIDVFKSCSESMELKMSNKNGKLFSYTHFNNKIVSVVSLACQTDFAANTDVFKSVGESLAKHVACSEAMEIPELLEEDSIFDDRKISEVISSLSKELKENIEILKFYKIEFNKD